MAKLASRDFLLSQKPRAMELHVPEWQASVRIEAMTVERRVAFTTILQENAKAVADHKADPTKNPPVEPMDEALLGMVFSIVDDEGDLLFTVDDIPALLKLPYTQIQHIYLQLVALAYSNGDIVKEVEAQKKG